ALLFAVNASAALQLPANQIVEATGPGGAFVTFAASADGSGDDENGRPIDRATCAPSSGSLFPLGTTTVQCTSSSASGSFDITVVDTKPPVLDLPHGITVPGSSSGATVTYQASAYDLVDGATLVTCSPASGSFFAAGTATVHCSSTDTRNNTASGSFAVSVIPQPPPPPPPFDDITAEATGPDGAVVTYSVPSGVDDDNGRPLVNGNCAPISGSTFPLGETTVQCALGTFKITVVDTTPPALLLPADFTSESSVVTYTASAQDLVDGSVLVTCNPASGSTFVEGTTLVQCSASDTRGNSASGSFNVTVEEQDADTEAPTILSLVATPNVLQPPNGHLVTVNIAAEVFDNIDDSPYVSVFDVTSNESITDADWNILDPLRVELSAERDPQGSGREYTIWVEAIDDAGNRSVGTVVVTVPHDNSGSSVSEPSGTTKRRRRAVR
ncbi:MAG: HYR domain-containing protein, partial [Thermoanaerobaculia bacterium]